MYIYIYYLIICFIIINHKFSIKHQPLTTARTGAVLIVLYAVVVPILKLLLLALAEVFRRVVCSPLMGDHSNGQDQQ